MPDRRAPARPSDLDPDGGFGPTPGYPVALAEQATTTSACQVLLETGDLVAPLSPDEVSKLARPFRDGPHQVPEPCRPVRPMLGLGDGSAVAERAALRPDSEQAPRGPGSDVEHLSFFPHQAPPPSQGATRSRRTARLQPDVVLVPPVRNFGHVWAADPSRPAALLLGLHTSSMAPSSRPCRPGALVHRNMTLS